jgi:hypothetical protein
VRRTTLFAALLMACAPALVSAQMRKLRVVSSDSMPIVYAYVTVEGGTGQISDERGEISLGAGKKQTVTVNVRRIGYQPWFGKMELPDTAAVLTVTLPRLAQQLGQVRVTAANNAAISLPMKAFYDRWMMRQKGLLSAVFIGPEELEFRHPDKITNMLSGLNGVSFRRTDHNEAVVMGGNGTCQMAIVVDGVRQCPGKGCKCDGCGTNGMSIGGRSVKPDTLNEMSAVVIDRLIDANNVSAIEVYNRGGNMPVGLQVSDPGCGVIAIWTGSRKP